LHKKGVLNKNLTTYLEGSKILVAYNLFLSLTQFSQLVVNGYEHQRLLCTVFGTVYMPGGPVFLKTPATDHTIMGRGLSIFKVFRYTTIPENMFPWSSFDRLMVLV